MSDVPTVSVLVPVFNEIDHLGGCLASLTAQDYPRIVEIIVADGGSDDGTLELLEQWQSKGVRVVANRHRVQSAGLNLAAREARGEILVRADAHSTYAADYVSRSVDSLVAHQAQAVGGPMRVVGNSRFEGAVAAAMSTPLGVGPARFHGDGVAGPTDTVYLGAFRRDHFLARGGYRTLPSGVAEDADMYYRWRREGDVVWLDPAIRSQYRPRSTWRSLARQFYRYGRGKADMLFLNGRFPSLRPLAPVGLVLAISGSAVAWGLGLSAWPLAAVVGLWLSTLVIVWAVVARPHWRIVGIIAVMHLTYGTGFLVSSLSDSWRLLGPQRRRDAEAT